MIDESWFSEIRSLYASQTVVDSTDTLSLNHVPSSVLALQNLGARLFFRLPEGRVESQFAS